MIISTKAILLSRARGTSALTPAARLWQAIVRKGDSEQPQTVIARKYGVRQSTVSGWKAGQGGVDLPLATRLEGEHGIRAAYVVFGDGPPLVSDVGRDEFARGVEIGRELGLREAAAAIRALAASTAVPPFDGLEPVTGAEAEAILDAVDGLHDVPPDEDAAGQEDDSPEDQAVG